MIVGSERMTNFDLFVKEKDFDTFAGGIDAGTFRVRAHIAFPLRRELCQ